MSCEKGDARRSIPKFVAGHNHKANGKRSSHRSCAPLAGCRIDLDQLGKNLDAAVDSTSKNLEQLWSLEETEAKLPKTYLGRSPRQEVVELRLVQTVFARDANPPAMMHFDALNDAVARLLKRSDASELS